MTVPRPLPSRPRARALIAAAALRLYPEDSMVAAGARIWEKRRYERVLGAVWARLQADHPAEAAKIANAGA